MGRGRWVAICYLHNRSMIRATSLKASRRMMILVAWTRRPTNPSKNKEKARWMAASLTIGITSCNSRAKIRCNSENPAAAQMEPASPSTRLSHIRKLRAILMATPEVIPRLKIATVGVNQASQVRIKKTKVNATRAKTKTPLKTSSRWWGIESWMRKCKRYSQKLTKWSERKCWTPSSISSTTTSEGPMQNSCLKW